MKQTTPLDFVLTYAIALIVGFAITLLVRRLTKRDGEGDYEDVQFIKQFILYPIIIAPFRFFYLVGQFFKRIIKRHRDYWNSDDAHPESLL